MKSYLPYYDYYNDIMSRDSRNNISQILIISSIVITIFFIGYFLQSLRSISSMIGDYFIISTEILPLVLSFAIFIVAWYSYDKSKDNHWIFLGFVCLVIGLIDLFHLLSYPFMPDFISPNSSQKATVFWSEARLVSALLLLASVYVNKNSFPDVIDKKVLFVICNNNYRVYFWLSPYYFQIVFHLCMKLTGIRQAQVLF